jgi:hypothetical protein
MINFFNKDNDILVNYRLKQKSSGWSNFTNKVGTSLTTFFHCCCCIQDLQYWVWLKFWVVNFIEKSWRILYVASSFYPLGCTPFSISNSLNLLFVHLLFFLPKVGTWHKVCISPSYYLVATFHDCVCCPKVQKEPPIHSYEILGLNLDFANVLHTHKHKLISSSWPIRRCQWYFTSVIKSFKLFLVQQIMCMRKKIIN